jgi:hypothetical protein
MTSETESEKSGVPKKIVSVKRILGQDAENIVKSPSKILEELCEQDVILKKHVSEYVGSNDATTKEVLLDKIAEQLYRKQSKDGKSLSLNEYSPFSFTNLVAYQEILRLGSRQSPIINGYDRFP